MVNLKIDTKTIQLLEENLGVNVYNCELGNDFLDMTPKKATQEKIDKFDIKI